MEVCTAVDRWGVEVDAFMIGGMDTPNWFEYLVYLGWALISTKEDFNGTSPLPMTGPDGETQVVLMNGISQLGVGPETGNSGDWVIRYAPDNVHICKQRYFNYEFVIRDRGDT